MNNNEITFKRSTLIIIIILIGILMFGILIYTENKKVPTNIIIESQQKNNIQATHTYTEQISARDTLTCIKADTTGKLYGSSMQPTFHEDNTVILKNYTENMTIKTGDIIRYYTNCTTKTTAVIHRVNAVYDTYIVTQGDNQNTQEQVQQCQITGIVIGIIYT